MSIKTLVVLNGPKRCGKNTIGKSLVDMNFWFKYDWDECDFKDELISMALIISGVSRVDWEDRYDQQVMEGSHVDDARKYVSVRWMKDVPWDKLGGYSQRQFLIKLSEEWVKPVFGDQHFGRLLKNELDHVALDGDIYVNTSGGFNSELLPFYADPDWQVLLVKISRLSCSFDGDSRNYITKNFNKMLVVDNSGDIGSSVSKINEFIKENLDD